MGRPFAFRRRGRGQGLSFRTCIEFDFSGRLVLERRGKL